MDKLFYIIKKLVSLVVIMLIVSIFVFFSLRASSVDPLTVILSSKQSTEELRQSYTEQYGLDQSTFKQYLDWLSAILHGDLGTDWVTKQSISLQISEKLPITLGLVILSSLIGVPISILLGVLASKYRGKAGDTIISLFMLVISSIPSFLIGIIAIIFCITYIPTYSFIGSYATFGEYISRLMLPSAVMALSLLAILGRVTRSSMIQQLQSPYIITAQAKGLSQRSVVFKHAFHNGVIPVITVAAYMIASSIGATVLIENVFSLPGIGSMLIDAILQSNYPVIQVLVLILLGVYMTVSFLVDILYTIVDPRVSTKTSTV